jgi:hypothetical protein
LITEIRNLVRPVQGLLENLVSETVRSRNSVIEGGLPHSEILGSKPVRGSPRLIAAYHVLHRLSAPRHPPDTLLALDCSHRRCPPLGRGYRSVTRLLNSSSGPKRDRRIQCFFLCCAEKRPSCFTANHPKDVGVVRRRAQRRLRTNAQSKPESLRRITIVLLERAMLAHHAPEQRRSDGLPYSRCHAARNPPKNSGGGKKYLFHGREGSVTSLACAESGGARRDRTDDLLLAKQALSQLSYGPVSRSQTPQHNRSSAIKREGEWWAWDDSNVRPHPYQGCALTT